MKVVVVKYNPNWPAKFEQESLLLKSLLPEVIHRIHHIGSTAVPGLMAKPIIDIILEVSDLGQLDAESAKFETLGYEVMGEFGIPGRRYFRKGGDHRTHHIHAFVSGDPHIKRHLAFRDYLIAHEEVAQAYGTLKSEVAERSNNGLEEYCDGKDSFVKLHEQKALEWLERMVK